MKSGVATKKRIRQTRLERAERLRRDLEYEYDRGIQDGKKQAEAKVAQESKMKMLDANIALSKSIGTVDRGGIASGVCVLYGRGSEAMTGVTREFVVQAVVYTLVLLAAGMGVGEVAGASQAAGEAIRKLVARKVTEWRGYRMR